MNKYNFHKKHVLISGGSSGIGLAIAKVFFSSGADVTILARRKDLLDAAVQQLESVRINTDQKIASFSCDVTDFQGLKKSLSMERAAVDILINSAGIAFPGEFAALDQGIFSKVMDVNYMGTVNLTKLIVPEMLSRGSGHIVNISSLAAVIGIYGYTAYAPSKYAVRGFSRCLRAELASHGINVSVVLPPDTDTPQLEFEHTLLPETTRKINQNGGILSPEKVADATIKGIARKKFTIIPGLEGKILYIFAPIFGRYFYHFAVKENSK